MTDDTQDPIPRRVSLLVLEVLELGPAAVQSTQPLDRRRWRDRCRVAGIMLREALPGDAFDDDARPITLATNDPARGEP
jgi:hypothetical protein